MALSPQQFERLKTLSSSVQQPYGLGAVRRDVAGDIAETYTRTGEEFFKAGEKIVDTAQQRDLSIGEKIRGIGSETFRGGSRGIGELFLGGAKVLTPQSIEEDVAEKVGEAGQTIGQTETAQRLVGWYGTLTPDVKRDVDNALGFAEGLADLVTFKAVGTVGRTAFDVARRQAVEGAGVTAEAAKRGVEAVTPNVLKDFHARLDPSDAKAAENTLVTSYKTAFVEDVPTINRKLQKISAGRSFGDVTVTPDDLIRELVREGITPEISGKLSDFTKAIDDLSARQNKLTEAIHPLLDTIPTMTPLEAMRKVAQSSLLKSPQILEDVPLAQRQLDRFFDSFKEKMGDSLTAQQLNSIVTRMNSRTRAFDKDAFVQDAANIVANTMRRRIDELVENQDVRNAYKEWGRLQQLKTTAGVFDLRKVRVNEFVESLGRWTGVVTLGASGIGFAAGGPGGLVVASLAAKYGGDVFAQFLRSKKFSQRAKDILIQTLRTEPDVVRRLIDTAETRNKEILERLLLPAPGKTSIIEAGRAPREPSPSVVPAKKTVGRDPKTGRFKRFYQSIGETLKDQRGFVKNPLAKSGDQSKLKRQGVSSTNLTTAFSNKGELSTKVLSKLDGKTVVSRQFISDLTKTGDLKQAERELIREVLEEMDGDKINVTEFADKVKTRLLPLERQPIGRAAPNETGGIRYESTTLPDELRGNVADYDEILYESPIKNSAGGVHFDHLGLGEGERYFAHTRIEDMADGTTRRVIEAQSDLFQKGRLESELDAFKDGDVVTLKDGSSRTILGGRQSDDSGFWYRTEGKDGDFNTIFENQIVDGIKQAETLQPYRNTWWERIIREEVRSAAQDGKTKLQFPTGETAMKIEGLGEQGDDAFFGLVRENDSLGDFMTRDMLKPEQLKVGQTVARDFTDQWIITEVLENGKFKAVPKNVVDAQKEAKIVKDRLQNGESVYLVKEGAGSVTRHDTLKEAENRLAEVLDTSRYDEQFDISGKVDTSNPIYRFYEKDMQKYLKNKYGAKQITDEQGVNWVEMDVPKDAAKMPVEAFGIIPFIGIAASEE